MIINTDVETFIWVYVSTSLKFITVHTKPGIRHNTSEVTWWDLNPESWQIMIKDYFSSHVFISKIFVSGFLKTRLHWGFHILNYLVPVSQTHTVSKWFLSDCSCVLLLLLFKNPQPLCLFQPLSAVQTVVAWRGLQRSEWCSWRLCCDLCCCGFHRNETTVGRRQSGRKKMTSPSPTHSDSSGSSKHDSNQVCGHFNVQYVSIC